MSTELTPKRLKRDSIAHIGLRPWLDSKYAGHGGYDKFEAMTPAVLNAKGSPESAYAAIAVAFNVSVNTARKWIILYVREQDMKEGV